MVTSVGEELVYAVLNSIGSSRESSHGEHQVYRAPILLQRKHKLLLILASLRVSQRELDPVAKVL